jgi:SHS2 domain-containing protein
MPYRYLEHIATADVAFHAWGETVEKMFISAADATMNVMVEDLNTIHDREHRSIRAEEDAMDMLLFQLLQELIYFKDAERLLLRVRNIYIENREGRFTLSTEAYGEEINALKHALNVDVKAVTLHRFQVEQTSKGWEATVILDI